MSRIISIYVDGSAPINRASETNPAGWGFVVVEDAGINHEGGTKLFENKGKVITDNTEENYIGADVGSNNTGELSAIWWATRWSMINLEPTDIITIYGDSEYAGNMATGNWKPKQNKELVRSVRNLWQEALLTQLNISWAHVRAHQGFHWNEVADALANEGART